MRLTWVSIGVCALLVVGGLRSQQSRDAQRSVPPNTANFPSINPDRRDSRDPREPDSPSPLAAIQEAQRTKAIANDRQKRIVDDTAKLLQLATELKSAVDKTTKDQLSLDVIRKADEIEKLAHDVKQRMRS